MKWLVKFENEVLGSVITSHSMTDEEICELAGVELAKTQEDFEGMPENGMYDLDELDIVQDTSAEEGEKMNLERAEEIAAQIRAMDSWDLELCKELCELADLSEAWEQADGEDFESALYAAAEKLGVEI